MNNESAENETFYLGITMAGAVSAGCYTAGAMDYLFEILDLWEKAKNKTGGFENVDGDLVPKHKVVIDAMGGASAGGMVTIMSAIYALEGIVSPVKEKPSDDSKKFNILYDKWVYLDDDNRPTFDQLWDTDDLDEGKLMSLLNSKIIDNIATSAFTFAGERDVQVQRKKMAPYISQDLEILLSHSMLHGIPLEVDFTSEVSPDEKSKHTTYEHFMISHFKFPDEGKDESGYLKLDPYGRKEARNMRASTMATGAFPIGLRYRSLEHMNDEYYKQVVKRIVYADFGNPDPDNGKLIDLQNFPGKFKTFAVDGGAINNEPYSEVMSILKYKHKNQTKCFIEECPRKKEEEDRLRDKKEFNKYGLVMIDPFPDRSEDENYEQPNDLVDVAPQIVQMLWNQSKVKRAETIADFRNEYRGEIYPSRKNEKGEKDPFPLASGSFMAFGGFLDINFRKYDFFLGRDNARSFYRHFFSLPYYEGKDELNHPIHRGWNELAIQKFKIKNPDPRNGGPSFYLPIVPDMNLLLEKAEDKSSRSQSDFYTVKERPVYDVSRLIKLTPAIQNRFFRIFGLLENKLIHGKKTEAAVMADALMDEYYNVSWWRKIKTKVQNIFFRMFERWLAKKAAKMFIRLILEDLAKRDLIKRKNK